MLSQQIVAEVSAREYGEDELFDLMRGAYPYRNLDGKISTRGAHACRGHRHQARPPRPYLHRDAVNHVLRARKGARLTHHLRRRHSDNADYAVILEPLAFCRTLNEDFAIESLAGDIFQLGNTSYRILRVEAGRVRVEDQGSATQHSVLVSEAPARTDELPNRYPACARTSRHCCRK